MTVFNDPGVYVVQSPTPAPLTPVLAERAVAIIGPMYQIVEQNSDSDTGSIISLEEPSVLSIPYPSLISLESKIDLDSVKVKVVRRDGRVAEITEVCDISLDEIVLDLSDAAVLEELHDLNDSWGGNSEENNFLGVEGAPVHVEYRALREDLVGRVLSAHGADITTVIGKMSVHNPLGLAGGIAGRLTANGIYFVPTGEDVDEDVDMALDLIEPLNVYTPVVLSANPLTQQAVIAHCVRMSEPDERSFRFAWTYRPFASKEDLLDQGLIDETTTLAEIKNIQAADMVDYAQSLFEKRATVIPHDFDIELEGVDYTVPGYYLAVAYAALKNSLPPQQGLTNYPLGGIVKRLHMSNNYFRPSQLKALSQGGVFVCLQSVEGGAIRNRFQVTTNMNNNKTKQISLIYAVDAYSMGYIRTLQSLIGVNNVTPQILEGVEMSTSAYATANRESGTIISAKLISVRQNADDKSRVDVEQEVEFPTPLDKIVLRLRY